MLVFVGEITNPPGMPARYDLTGAAGKRLAALAGVPFVPTFLKWRRFNLCRDVWSDEEATRKAAEILNGCRDNDMIVMLGTRVTEAFMRAYRYRHRMRRFETVVTDRGVGMIAFPHPSGRSRYWNDHDNYVEASRVLRRLVEDHA